MKLSNLLWLVLILLLTAGCSLTTTVKAPLNKNSNYYQYIQPSFKQYIDISREWLQHNRRFIGEDKATEITMNAPFFIPSKTPSDKAILLVHGLGDSPFSFSDLAQSIASQGVNVYGLLLPGHGSKPEDLLLPSYQDWQNIVDHYGQILSDQYKQLWLGGFSTGANLVTIHASKNSNIKGLLLFSPGFQSRAGNWEKLTPLLAMISDWGWQGREENKAKYSSSPINGALAYVDSAEELRSKLEEKAIKIPSMVIMSEADSVINAGKVHQLFENSFNHQNNKLIWYGQTEKTPKNVTAFPMNIAEHRISTGSHMGVLFAPDNPYYGKQGEKRLCNNGLTAEEKAICEGGADVWYSGYGYKEENKIHARLTWNPHYHSLEKDIASFFSLN